ncbi:glycosyltransferase family 25 protein [Oceanicella actignis]|uniref:glycosyltransferase family 25 protein n=1 Tax=Oceanicella actignis TaxID=1189325 RepID=UPI0011E6B583|nr:glycosyltransferase family 25 protein [Oceanicella actignis]TYO89683.1 GR25 family glycosyltransferase involved in LPS biosynthesis [Oceanicella actignis]
MSDRAQPFDAWLINLDRDSGRLTHMRAELAAAGIAWRRFAALTPDAIPPALRPAFFDEAGAPHAPLRPGEIACYASHLSVMALIAESGRPGLVMEDDLRLAPGFAELARLLAAAPADWGFLRLSNAPKSACREVARDGALALVECWRVPNNAGAYLVNPAAARRFIAAYPRRLRPIDEDMRRVWEHGCVSYVALPRLAELNIFESSIDAAGARGDAPARRRFEAARRRLGGEPAWRWQLRRWGLAGAARAMGRGIALSLRKRVSGRRARPEDHLLRR